MSGTSLARFRRRGVVGAAGERPDASRGRRSGALFSAAAARTARADRPRASTRGRVTLTAPAR